MSLRYAPGLALPTLRYLPGRSGARPAAHVHGAYDDAALAFRWGVDLYNHGFAWEAHEVWEARWRAARGADRALLQGLIQCAAACVKAQLGVPEVAAGIARRAAARLGPLGVARGLDASAYALDFVRWIDERPETLERCPRVVRGER